MKVVTADPAGEEIKTRRGGEVRRGRRSTAGKVATQTGKPQWDDVGGIAALPPTTVMQIPSLRVHSEGSVTRLSTLNT